MVITGAGHSPTFLSVVTSKCLLVTYVREFFVLFFIIFFIGFSTFYSTIQLWELGLAGTRTRGQSDVAVCMGASSPHGRVDLLGELLHSWAAILRPQKPIRQCIAKVFHLQPSHSSSLTSSLDYRREAILPAVSFSSIYRANWAGFLCMGKIFWWIISLFGRTIVGGTVVKSTNHVINRSLSYNVQRNGLWRFFMKRVVGSLYTRKDPILIGCCGTHCFFFFWPQGEDTWRLLQYCTMTLQRPREMPETNPVVELSPKLYICNTCRNFTASGAAV